ncbi:hypothetical protein CDD81_3967 [Ophiocordyceps australis]|uniref:BZIP domain-containing protein n=1 Tax=Ophiocordyceps australis TaxID=1399860 RepID=A0A2C5XNZ2_9HYPO|nr:hypothetical protein CDD81_3967 [Ophiocordyceps australis]
MADGARPSFTAFWKKLKSKRSTVVQQKAVSDEAGDQNKAQIRRQQVRRAQLEHRQRKAGYVRQLELDVAQLRDSIAHVEQESGVLRRENDVIRGVLQRAGVELDPESQRPRGDAAAAAGELFGGIDVDKVMVTLSMDAVMGRPCFHIEAPPKQQPTATPTAATPTAAAA